MVEVPAGAARAAMGMTGRGGKQGVLVRQSLRLQDARRESIVTLPSGDRDWHRWGIVEEIDGTTRTDGRLRVRLSRFYADTIRADLLTYVDRRALRAIAAERMSAAGLFAFLEIERLRGSGADPVRYRLWTPPAPPRPPATSSIDYSAASFATPPRARKRR